MYFKSVNVLPCSINCLFLPTWVSLSIKRSLGFNTNINIFYTLVHFFHCCSQRHIINFHKEKSKSLNNVNNITKIWVKLFSFHKLDEVNTFKPTNELFTAFIFGFLILILIYLFGH